ncbi:MAG: uracil-DNA glycosylase [Methylococcales bacterium]|nr:uracil-DNA glycosylase [Methylococcales bacterium]MDD5754934.1 uracil-DNA glycosylase [Methylococcales bacterium]
MALSKTTRLQYLNALGITVWQSRFMPESLAPPIESAQIIATKIPLIDSWEHLRADVTSCQLCSLCTTRTQTVFGDGNLNAEWLFIGEAPGEHEDKQGKPFVGEAGKLLTEMLRAMRLTREEIFITNILKCRPPLNRDPHSDEIRQCHTYLQQQIALIQPKIIIAVGRIAAQTLLGTHETIGKLRGKVHSIENVPLIAIYHPAYLLRSLIEKRKAWQDLQFALQTFKSL